jgi:hypothetical protein
MDLVERPDAEPAIVVDLMRDGFAIERNPVPAASIVATGAAAEVVLQRLSESAEAIGKDGGPEEAFAPKPLTGDPAEIFGGIQVIDGDAEGAQTFLRQLIGAVERPTEDDEASAETESTDAPEASGEASVQPESDTSRSAAMLLALRRSKLGKAAAVAAISVGGIMGFGASSAKALTPLEQECVTDGMKPMHIVAAKMHGAHKDGGNGWYGRVRGNYAAMPQECTDNNIYRVLNSRIVLENGEHPGQWSMIYPWDGSRWNGHRNNKGYAYNDRAYGTGPHFSNTAYQHNHNWTQWAYSCRPGPAKTQVLFQDRHTVIHVDGAVNDYGYHINGAIQILAGTKTYNRPIKVDGAC